MTDRIPVTVTITVTVGADTATYDADASTSTDGWDVAMSLIHGLKQGALEGTARRRGAAAAARGETARPASQTAHLGIVTQAAARDAATGAARVAQAGQQRRQVGG